jgi:putative drug exporter of the RND superfamily
MVVFGSFMGESDRVVKLLLVPATMERLGDRNWWIPRWLDRILPRVHIEAPADLDAELAELEEVERGQQESVSE